MSHDHIFLCEADSPNTFNKTGIQMTVHVVATSNRQLKKTDCLHIKPALSLSCYHVIIFILEDAGILDMLITQ